MAHIKVIGIDPAPSKNNTVFDGNKLHDFTYKELKNYLVELKKNEPSLLICWDAPLLHCDEEFLETNGFYTRKIERFFTNKEGCKTPEGISVRGYGGCPHWAITQYMTGYPMMSDHHEAFRPPFELIFDKKKITQSIVEVHPAVAIWQWCKELKIKEWTYKKDKTVFKKIVETLNKKKILPEDTDIKNDDQLDAIVAWKLGHDWINKTGVELLGDNKQGAFLLPYSKELFKAFEQYTPK